MTGLRRALAAALCGVFSLAAQESAIAPVRPQAPVLWRPYLAPEVPAARLNNSARLASLIRAGSLYLTVQDAIELALENNIDIEVARYNPIAAEWRVERAEAGGALPGVPSGSSQANSVASGQGVAGSQAAAGVSFAGNNGGASTTGNATITQVGPVTQTLDPSIQETTTFSHKTTPEPNSVQSVLPVLIQNGRAYSASYQQGFLTGGSITVNYQDHYLNENAPTDVLNPSSSNQLSVSFQHNLLRGFGIAVNSRTITVAKINLKTSDLNFKSQLTSTVGDVLNAYWALAADSDDVKAKEAALETSQRFLDDNRRRLEAGSLAPLDVTTAEAQVATAQQDLVVSQTSLRQQELQIKNLISRRLNDPLVANVRVVPLDHITIPLQDNVAPLDDMVKTALANRTDLIAEKVAIETSEISALGTKNGLLPSLQVFGARSQAGLAGAPRTVVFGRNVETANNYFVGGIGTALGQIFRSNFPTQRVGEFFGASIHNRQAQADYAVDQLQLRQQQLETQKDQNQLQVDIMNAVVALQQARARYDAAMHNRVLDEQLLDAEQKKFRLGASTPYNVIQQQRDLVIAQATELSSLVAYTNARVTLDQALGTILDNNHIEIRDRTDAHVREAPSGPAVK